MKILRRIFAAEDFQDNREPPLRLGDIVKLNSGGPRLLVVDLLTADRVTTSWRDESGSTFEQEFPRASVHRTAVTD